MTQGRRPERAELCLRFSWPYDDALGWMEQTRERVLAGGAMALAVGEHDREVITLGRHTPASDLLRPEVLEQRGILLRRIDRGGGATAHGPGQLVCYPVISLERLGLDVPSLTAALEGAVVDVLRDLGVESTPGTQERGVYVDGAKIASVGFRVIRGVVTHGLALNLDNDLAVFGLIATCGRASRAMTSVAVCAPGFRNNQREEVARGLARRVASRCVLELPT